MTKRPTYEELERRVKELESKEEALRKSEERFYGMFEHTSSGVAIYEAVDNGEDFVFRAFNPAAERITHISRTEALGNRLLDLFPHMDTSGLLGALQRVFRTGQEEHLPPFYYKDEIREGWRENRIYKLPTGEIVALFDDVTEQKQAEEALRKSETFLKTVINTIPTPIFYKERDGKYLWFNSAFETFFGEKKERLIGKSVFDINPPELAEIYHAQDTRLFNSGGIQRYDSQMKNAHGELRDIIFNKAGITDREGAVTGLIGAIIDITERKKAEKERRSLEIQLQQAQKMESIGTLAGGIAHDFNNILAIILGNAELAADDIPEKNPAGTNLQEIRQASIRAKKMIQQLLSFSRKTDQETKPLNLVPTVNDSLKMLRTAIPSSVEFNAHITVDPCNILGDAAQINQIVMNLATNAAHAMSENGGLLEVTLENIVLQEETPCVDWMLSPGAYAKLKVRDTGEGIDANIMDRIFEPYFTTKAVGKGTGMGLSVIHGIVKRHKGGIRVESKLGKGTLFEVYFSLLMEKVGEKITPMEEIKGGAERILFVDDEPSIVDLNHQRLERLGYQVKSTTKPLEALEWFKADPDQFDMIITDMTMPRMTGDRLSAEILAIQPEMPVIICTGYSEKISAEEAETLGVAKYIEKPIELQKLASLLREILQDKSVTSQ